jgi:Protein of unknown function (DUF3303)
MLFMVVENFGENAAEVYRRFDERGRMMPEGLEYVSSWIDSDMKKCFQLMETEDESLFAKWTENWDDLVEFEIIPVMISAEARELRRKN